MKKRSSLLRSAREFFYIRNFTEVDCPSLRHFPPLDDHIDAFEVSLGNGVAYLHTSPEYGMKRLLSEGIGDIFQISHVFRKDEEGQLHNPEFTMAEWYRVGMDFSAFIEESALFVKMFVGDLPVKRVSYRGIIQEICGIDIEAASQEELVSLLENTVSSEILSLSKDGLLQWIMGFIIEPKLSGDTIWIIEDFPASQAALAQVVEKQGTLYAQRFEIYYQGVELANGYSELTDASVQEERFKAANLRRIAQGKSAYPIDKHLLEALRKGLPSCCGVAMGLDRLILLALKQEKLSDILPFGFENA